jgi:hypothetical protein
MILAMDGAYWTKKMREAEAELDAARKLAQVKAAAKKLQRAKAELRQLEGEPSDPLRADRRRDRLPGF